MCPYVCNLDFNDCNISDAYIDVLTSCDCQKNNGNVKYLFQEAEITSG